MTKESFFARCKRIYQSSGLWGFFKRSSKLALSKCEPLYRLIYYPYAKWKVPQTVEKTYTTDQAVDLALTGFGKFIQPSQIRSEIVELAKIVDNLKPKTVVEIGTSKGGTFYIWARLATKDARLLSIDMPGGENSWAYPNWKKPFYRTFASKGQKIDLFRGSSHDASMLQQLKSALNGTPVDFLFIDGDHSFEGVKQDYEMYSSFVRKGGIIAFHDIAQHSMRTNCRVKEFWDIAKQGKTVKEFVENPNQGAYGIGVMFV